MSAFETIASYGSRVDVRADGFLTRNSSELYGMLRYFMGYTDEHFEPTTLAKGKRLRPGLLLYLANQYGVLEKAFPAALATELFHNFTLIHDDIEDGDELRRGRPTVWKLWGVNKAINAGDAQLICAMQALRDGNVLKEGTYTLLEQFLLTLYLKVIEGQQLDFVLAETSLSAKEVTVDSYLEMITKKSAELIAASTWAAGCIAERSLEEQTALYGFGLNFGIAYQLRDDRESIWGDSKKTGKESGGDMREHKKTYPIIYARDVLSKEDSTRLQELYAEEIVSVEAVLILLEKAGTHEGISKLIRKYANEANECLSNTSLSSDAKETLKKLVEELVLENIVLG